MDVPNQNTAIGLQYSSWIFCLSWFPSCVWCFRPLQCLRSCSTSKSGIRSICKKPGSEPASKSERFRYLMEWIYFQILFTQCNWLLLKACFTSSEQTISFQIADNLRISLSLYFISLLRCSLTPGISSVNTSWYNKLLIMQSNCVHYVLNKSKTECWWNITNKTLLN